MLISRHTQATTTPKIRAAIQARDEPERVLADRYGISEQTVWTWRKRHGTGDRSHTPHRLWTTLTPAQEAVAVSLRETLPLPLDDLLAVGREFLKPSCLRRDRADAAPCTARLRPDHHAHGRQIGNPRSALEPTTLDLAA